MLCQHSTVVQTPQWWLKSKLCYKLLDTTPPIGLLRISIVYVGHDPSTPGRPAGRRAWVYIAQRPSMSHQSPHTRLQTTRCQDGWNKSRLVKHIFLFKKWPKIELIMWRCSRIILRAF